MGTKFKFEQSAGQAACTMTVDDGGEAFVFCNLPGGIPQFQVSRQSLYSSPVKNAPQCDTFKAFKSFVLARFADEAVA